MPGCCCLCLAVPGCACLCWLRVVAPCRAWPRFSEIWERDAWLCLVVLGRAWPCLVVHGCVWRISCCLKSAVLGGAWPCLSVCLFMASPGRCLRRIGNAVLGCAWLCLTVPGCAWLCLAMLGCAWLCLAVLACVWLGFLVIYDGFTWLILGRARDHGRGHGLKPWLSAIASGHGLGPCPCAMTLGHGLGTRPWVLRYYLGPRQWPCASPEGRGRGGSAAGRAVGADATGAIQAFQLGQGRGVRHLAH